MNWLGNVPRRWHDIWDPDKDSQTRRRSLVALLGPPGLLFILLGTSAVFLLSGEVPKGPPSIRPPFEVGVTPRYTASVLYNEEMWKISERIDFSEDELTSLRDAVHAREESNDYDQGYSVLEDLEQLGWFIQDYSLQPTLDVYADVSVDGRWIIVTLPDGSYAASPSKRAAGVRYVSHSGWTVRRTGHDITLRRRCRCIRSSQARVNQLLLDELFGQGWMARQKGKSLQFTRSRSEPTTEARRGRLTTTQRLPLSLPEGFDIPGGQVVTFEPSMDSRLTLSAPEHAIVSTFPPGLHQVGAGKDKVTIELPSPEVAGDVQVRMLPPRRRGEFWEWLARRSIGELIIGLLTTVIGSAVVAALVTVLVSRVTDYLQQGRQLRST
jgi:hypothetical protein